MGVSNASVLGKLETALLEAVPTPGSLEFTGFKRAFLQSNGGPLLEIHVEQFGSADELEAIVKTYSSILPGGFLSIPDAPFGQLIKPAGVVKRPDFDAGFRFAMVSGTLEDTTARRNFAYDCFDRFIEAALDRFIPKSFWPSGWAFDPVTITQWGFVNKPELIAAVFAFSVRCRGIAREVALP